jgi:hypothetical protein
MAAAEPANHAIAATTPKRSSRKVTDSEGGDSSAPDAAQVSEAAGTVAFIIGLNGYHCIRVIDAQDAGSGVYDVTCVTDHHGHQATYMVNSRNNDVARI